MDENTVGGYGNRCFGESRQSGSHSGKSGYLVVWSGGRVCDAVSGSVLRGQESRISCLRLSGDVSPMDVCAENHLYLSVLLQQPVSDLYVKLLLVFDREKASRLGNSVSGVGIAGVCSVLSGDFRSSGGNHICGYLAGMAEDMEVCMVIIGCEVNYE